MDLDCKVIAIRSVSINTTGYLVSKVLGNKCALIDDLYHDLGITLYHVLRGVKTL